MDNVNANRFSQVAVQDYRVPLHPSHNNQQPWINTHLRTALIADKGGE